MTLVEEKEKRSVICLKQKTFCLFWRKMRHKWDRNDVFLLSLVPETLAGCRSGDSRATQPASGQAPQQLE